MPRRASMLDIGSKSGYPAGELSNFTAREFEFDGVRCASMEGLIQALKFEDPKEQAELCAMVGFAAKKRGRSRNEAWQSQQRLWWKGVAMERSGPEYQEFLDRIFEALSQNEGFKKALMDTGDQELIHSIGESDPSKTALTEKEFCDRLTRLRARLSAKSAPAIKRG